MTILVVEMDDAERHLLLDLCAQAGCETVGFWEGCAALDYLQRAAAPMWVILLDLRIAQSDDAVCATLQRDPSLQAIPIVITSDKPNIAWQVARLGIGAYLIKPFADDVAQALVRCYAPRLRGREWGGIHDDPGGRR